MKKTLFMLALVLAINLIVTPVAYAQTVIATVTVGSFPMGGVNTATNKIYVSNFGPNTVSVIFDPPTASPPPPSQPVGGEILPIDITSLFIAGAFTNTFWILPMLRIVGAVIVIAIARRRKQ